MDINHITPAFRNNPSIMLDFFKVSLNETITVLMINGIMLSVVSVTGKE